MWETPFKQDAPHGNNMLSLKISLGTCRERRSQSILWQPHLLPCCSDPALFRRLTKEGASSTKEVTFSNKGHHHAQVIPACQGHCWWDDNTTTTEVRSECRQSQKHSISLVGGRRENICAFVWLTCQYGSWPVSIVIHISVSNAVSPRHNGTMTQASHTYLWKKTQKQINQQKINKYINKHRWFTPALWEVHVEGKRRILR